METNIKLKQKRLKYLHFFYNLVYKIQMPEKLIIMFHSCYNNIVKTNNGQVF